MSGKLALGAVDEATGQVVARAEADTLEAAVRSLVSRFAEMQSATIAALNASGIIRYVATDVEGMS